MGKWVFITFLLVVFSGLSFGRNSMPIGKIPVVSTGSDQASFSNGGSAKPLPKLLCVHIVLPQTGFHVGQSQVLQPQFQLNPLSRCYDAVKGKQPSPGEPVLKDHFHHLFPFFHFW